MSVELRYHLLLPKSERLFNTDYLTFTINHLRSRVPSVLYFIFHCFDIEGNELYVEDNTVKVSSNNLKDNGYTTNESEVAYVSSRGAVGTVFSTEGMDYSKVFQIPQILREASQYVQMELVTMGISSENPLYLSELMLQESQDGENSFTGFHTPSELTNNHKIKLIQNNYANLYDNEGNYLQVIRPNNDAFSTSLLDKATYTILAPHFEEEPYIDNHVSVFLECMNQTEQTINILR